MVNEVRSIVLAIFICLGFSPAAWSGDNFPTFKEYPVETSVEINNHPYVKTKEGAPSLEATRLAMAKHKPNLAGHYVAYSVDCGGGALCGEIIDVLNGKVVAAFPDAYMSAVEDEQESFDFSTRVDSRLIIILGVGQGAEIDQQGKKVAAGFYTRYYKFDGRAMKLLRLVKG